jgi:hypothetical protein
LFFFPALARGGVPALMFTIPPRQVSEDGNQIPDLNPPKRLGSKQMHHSEIHNIGTEWAYGVKCFELKFVNLSKGQWTRLVRDWCSMVNSLKGQPLSEAKWDQCANSRSKDLNLASWG